MSLAAAAAAGAHADIAPLAATPQAILASLKRIAGDTARHATTTARAGDISSRAKVAR